MLWGIGAKPYLLPCAAGRTFDAVVSLEVLEHVAQPQAFIDSLAALAPGLFQWSACPAVRHQPDAPRVGRRGHRRRAGGAAGACRDA